jgi:hypothetical protein
MLTGRPRVSVTGRRVLLELSKSSADPDTVASTSPSVYSVPAADPARMVTPIALLVLSMTDAPDDVWISLMETCVDPGGEVRMLPALSSNTTCSAEILLAMSSLLTRTF